MTEEHPPYEGTPYVEPRTEPDRRNTAGRLAHIEYRLFHIEQRIDVLMNYLDPDTPRAERPEDV